MCRRFDSVSRHHLNPHAYSVWGFSMSGKHTLKEPVVMPQF